MSDKAVLILENDLDIRDALARILEATGLTVVVASTPDEARDRFAERDGRFRALMVDFILDSRENGADFIRWVRRQGYIGVIVAMTAWPDVEVLKGVGSNVLLRKPIDLNALLALFQ